MGKYEVMKTIIRQTVIKTRYTSDCPNLLVKKLTRLYIIRIYFSCSINLLKNGCSKRTGLDRVSAICTGNIIMQLSKSQKELPELKYL